MKDTYLYTETKKKYHKYAFIVYSLSHPPPVQNRSDAVNQTWFILQHDCVLRYWPHQHIGTARCLDQLKYWKSWGRADMIYPHYPALRDFINTSLSNNINNGNSSTRHSSRLHLTEVKSTRQALYLTPRPPVYLCTVHLTRRPMKVWLYFYNNANLRLIWAVLHEHTPLTCTVKF